MAHQRPIASISQAGLAGENDVPHPEERPLGPRLEGPSDGNATLLTKSANGPMTAYLSILCCSDGSYYVGTTRGSLEGRVAEHAAGAFGGYTSSRRPVSLVFRQSFEQVEDAIAAERQIKGWRREKKQALIRGDYEALPLLARRGPVPGIASMPVGPSRRGLKGRSSG